MAILTKFYIKILSCLAIIPLAFFCILWYTIYSERGDNLNKNAESDKIMKLFNVIVDDGKHIFRTLTAAKSKKELFDVYGGNGKFEKVQNVTKEYFTSDSPRVLDETLIRAGWGEGERRILCALLEEHMRKENIK